MSHENKTMPDSDYDLDKRPYGAIWESTKQFHSNLKVRSLEKAQYNKRLFHLSHVHEAKKELNEEIHQQIQVEREENLSSWLRVRQELASVIGGTCFGILAGKVIETGITQNHLNTIDPAFWIAGLVGVGLITYKTLA